MDTQRHAVVTGGGSGIGLAIAQALAGEGCTVSLLGRDRARLERATAGVIGSRAYVCDVGREDMVAAALDQAAADSGPIGILVNNAGVVRTAPFLRQSNEDWEAMWRTNVLGAVHTTRRVLGPMRELPEGRIINIASTASLKAYGYVSAYVASKHALLGLTRALALELAGTRVTVNAVCPGYADTAIITDAVENISQRTGRPPEEARMTFTSANPQGRLIDPAEVGATVSWLISEGARSVTGQAIAVAGGEVM